MVSKKISTPALKTETLLTSENCPKCHKKYTIRRFETIKCVNCGYSIKDFGDNVGKGWKLKIAYDKTEDKILILGNAKGLEFLAGACLAIIGKTDPSGHIHLEWQMGNLLEGSTQTLLEFSSDDADYNS